jgi:hypothetical protein
MYVYIYITLPCTPLYTAIYYTYRVIRESHQGSRTGGTITAQLRSSGMYRRR